jgi:hypothetical protein
VEFFVLRLHSSAATVLQGANSLVSLQRSVAGILVVTLPASSVALREIVVTMALSVVEADVVLLAAVRMVRAVRTLN